MSITELLQAIGDANISVQLIDNCTSRYQYTAKSANKLTIHTDEPFTAKGMDKFGIVIWVGRDQIKAAQKKLKDIKQ